MPAKAVPETVPPRSGDPAGTVARTARLLSVLGAALALACIVYASFTIDSAEKKLDDVNAQVVARQRALADVQAKFDQAQDKLNQADAEIAFAQQAYQRIARDLPPGAAQKAIQETAAADTASAKLPPVIYIHIAREDQRSIAVEVQDKLRSDRYIVPGIEYVGAKAPNHTQLRYFVRTDEGPVLDRTLKLLRSMGFDVDSQFIVMASLHSLRPHQFELWFGRDFHPRPSVP